MWRAALTRGGQGRQQGAPAHQPPDSSEDATMAWIILLIGSICEVGWLIGMKYADGFTRLWPSVIMVFFMAASVGCLGLAVKEIPAATAYAVWTGGSVAAVTVVGFYLFGEPATLLRIGSILLILIGMVGLRLDGVDP
jgi:quaternary ammonium compound-resistance protein SugE